MLNSIREKSVVHQISAHQDYFEYKFDVPGAPPILRKIQPGEIIPLELPKKPVTARRVFSWLIIAALIIGGVTGFWALVFDAMDREAEFNENIAAERYQQAEHNITVKPLRSDMTEAECRDVTFGMEGCKELFGR